MANYYIGDIQGCLDELLLLLKKIDFNPSTDILWSCGDIVARGPKSLEVLEFFFNNQDTTNMVLGNHDLHLLSVGYGLVPPNPQDKIQAILTSPKKEAMLKWLRQQPLIRHNAHHKTILCHAGIPPQWPLKKLLSQTQQVESQLQSEDFLSLLTSMYGNEPARWSETLSHINQMRYTINAVTRMRFVEDLTYALNFTHKSTPNQAEQIEGLIPWYKSAQPILDSYQVIFGHWAALLQTRPTHNVLALDTGCVWGGSLTLWHQEKNELISQEACHNN